MELCEWKNDIKTISVTVMSNCDTNKTTTSIIITVLFAQPTISILLCYLNHMINLVELSPIAILHIHSTMLEFEN